VIEEEEEERDLIKDLKRHGRLEVKETKSEIKGEINTEFH